MPLSAQKPIPKSAKLNYLQHLIPPSMVVGKYTSEPTVYTTGRLNLSRSDICIKACHLTPVMAWLNPNPNDSFCSDAGHPAPMIGYPERWLLQKGWPQDPDDGLVDIAPER